MEPGEQTHIALEGDNDSRVDYYILAPGVSLLFNRIYVSSWGREGIQLFIDLQLLEELKQNYLEYLGIDLNYIEKVFCSKKGIYFQQMDDNISGIIMKVIDIAISVGYENQGKFAKVFTNLYGVSPLEFRRFSK